MPVTLTFYDRFLQTLGDGTMDMDNDSFKLALLTNLHVFDPLNTVFADVVADEIVAGNGYVAGGSALTTVTYSETSGIIKFDADDVIFTATGGPIATSRFAVLYDDTPIVPIDPLLALIDLGVDKAPGIGDTLTIRWNVVNGVFTIQ